MLVLFTPADVPALKFCYNDNKSSNLTQGLCCNLCCMEYFAAISYNFFRAISHYDLQIIQLTSLGLYCV